MAKYNDNRFRGKADAAGDKDLAELDGARRYPARRPSSFDQENYPAAGIDALTESTQISYPAERLEDIPPDVEIDDATLTCWNGKRFVTWETWRGGLPIRGDPPIVTIPEDASVTALCDNGIRVWLLRSSDPNSRTGRWQMVFQAPGQKRQVRKDFATFWQRHAIATAELWYGVPKDGWQVHKDEPMNK